MSRYKFTSIDRILSKVIRDTGVEISLMESDVIEWTGEALEFIGATRMYEEAIAFAEVKNHQCELPPNLHVIIQVARNNAWSKVEEKCYPQELVNEMNEPNVAYVCNDVDMGYVVLDGCGTPVLEYDIAYYRPFNDLIKTSYYKQNYTPIRLATNSFFNSVVCNLEGNDSIYKSSDCVDEYTIIQGKLLRFSFKEGGVVIPYLRPVLDKETGYPMIPDHVSYTTAVTKYVTMKIFEKEFYSSREGSPSKFQKAESDWQWYCKQAGNLEMMPHGIDEHQNLLEQRSYLLPQQNRYYGFFGNLNKAERRAWGTR